MRPEHSEAHALVTRAHPHTRISAQNGQAAAGRGQGPLSSPPFSGRACMGQMWCGGVWPSKESGDQVAHDNFSGTRRSSLAGLTAAKSNLWADARMRGTVSGRKSSEEGGRHDQGGKLVDQYTPARGSGQTSSEPRGSGHRGGGLVDHNAGQAMVDMRSTPARKH